MAQVTDHTDSHQPLKLCWQLIASFSSHVENPKDKQAVEWLRRKLSYCTPSEVSSQNAGVERISLSRDFVKRTDLYGTKKLEIVVKAVTAAHLCSSAALYHQMQGTTGILLYVRKPNHGETVQVHLYVLAHFIH